MSYKGVSKSFWTELITR